MTDNAPEDLDLGDDTDLQWRSTEELKAMLGELLERIQVNLSRHAFENAMDCVEFENGRKAGLNWGRDEVTSDELGQLLELSRDDNGASDARRLLFLLPSGDSGDSSVAVRFWKAISGANANSADPTPDFIRGFAMGVLDNCFDEQ